MGAITVYDNQPVVRNLNGFDIVGGGLKTAHKAVEGAVRIIQEVGTDAVIKAAKNKGYGEEAGKVLNAVRFADELTIPANNVVETLSVIPAAAGALTAFTQTTLATAAAVKLVLGTGAAGVMCANAAPLAGLATAVVAAYGLHKGCSAIGNVVNFVGHKGYEFGSKIVSEATKSKENEVSSNKTAAEIELD